MTSLIRLTYTSTAVEEFSEDSLEALTCEAAQRNETRGLTGGLLYCGGNFLQVLEGPEDVVETLYERISGDPRHTWVETVQRDRIEDRMFPDWGMRLCVFDEHKGVDVRAMRVIRQVFDHCDLDPDQATKGLICYFTSRAGGLAA